VQALPPFVTAVALFVNADRAHIIEVLHQISFDALQFHGHETAQECASYHKPYIKALHVRPELDIPKMINEYKTAQGILCDAYHLDKPGGTGATFDWQLIPKNSPKPIILAGGLNPANIVDAIQQVNPYAVDVTSGVEQSPGIKDPQLLKEFIIKVREYDNTQQN
jgi:phosphoribosylanthranilate isomerase